MARIDINTYLNDNYNNTTTTIDNSKKGTATDVLFGKLELENYPNLTKIDLGNNELEEMVVIKCPNLEDINVSKNKITKADIKKAKTDTSDNPVPADKLKFLSIGLNEDLKEFSVEYCPNLEMFAAPGNDNLDRVPGLDKLKNLVTTVAKKGIMSHIIDEKLDYFRDVVSAVRQTLGKGPDEDLPKDSSGKLNLQGLTDYMEAGVSQQLQTAKTNAERERDKAQAKLDARKDYDDIKAERNELQQQLAAIRSELGISENANKQQIIDKIKELKGGVPLSDHNAVKSERDNLKNEVESKKRKIAELENKENESVITKKVLTEKTNGNWESWGVEISDNQKKLIQNAVSAGKVEEIRSEIISGEFSKLKDENNSSFYLNIILGVLTVSSLLLLGLVLMRQMQTNLPEKEPKKEKEK